MYRFIQSHVAVDKDVSICLIFPLVIFLQDISHKSTGTEGMSRREYRRRHYYAKEDSDEEQT